MEPNKEAAEEVLDQKGEEKLGKKSQDPTIVKGQAIRIKETGRMKEHGECPTKRNVPRNERNSKLTELHKRVQEKEY